MGPDGDGPSFEQVHLTNKKRHVLRSVLFLFHKVREFRYLYCLVLAFIGAGARSVLVSLWAIDDEATLLKCKILKRHFYLGDTLTSKGFQKIRQGSGRVVTYATRPI